MAVVTNRQGRSKSRPVGMIEESDFDLVEEPLAEPGDGEILIKTRYLAVEPAMQGFLLFGSLAGARAAIDEISKWIASGELVPAEDIGEGIENAPKTFQRLFQDKNLGKQLLKVAEPS